MSISEVVTRGLGSFGSPSAIITAGLSIGAPDTEAAMVTDLVTDLPSNLIKDIVR